MNEIAIANGDNEEWTPDIIVAIVIENELNKINKGKQLRNELDNIKKLSS